MVIGYLIDLESLKEQGQLSPQLPPGTNSFLVMLTAYYTQQIAHNLVWHIDLDDTLVMARMNRACLCQVTMIKDTYDQAIEATLLQMMKALCDRNTRVMREGEKPFGMFESLVALFKELEMETECKKQDEAWSLDEKASEETFRPYVAAMETFCQQIIKNEDQKIPGQEVQLDDAAYEKLLKIPSAEAFEKAFKQPRPGYVVRSGLLSIIGLYPKFLTIRQKYLGQLGENSHKDKLFSGKFFLVFQSMWPRCDLEIMKKGYVHVIRQGEDADHINFAHEGPGAGKCFSGLGPFLSFSSMGISWGTRGVTLAPFVVYSQDLFQAKISAVDLCRPR